MLILFHWQGGAAQPWLSSATGGEGQPAEERKVKKSNLVNVKVRTDRYRQKTSLVRKEMWRKKSSKCKSQKTRKERYGKKSN